MFKSGLKFFIVRPITMITDSFHRGTRSLISFIPRFKSLLSLYKTGRLQPGALRKFSTVLITTIVSLVAVSVVVMLFGVNRYFNDRVEDEFRKKLQAEKGQIEILIKNRLDDVNKILDDLSTDNTVRVTMMLDAQSKLMERIRQTYPPASGVYPFIQKGGSGPVIPQSYNGLSKEMIIQAFNVRPRGEVILDKDNPHLIWLFSKSIIGTEGDMGTAAVLYDMMEDTQLSKSIKKAVKGNLSFLNGDKLIPLGKNLPNILAPEILSKTSENSTTFRIIDTLAYSQVMANRNLYYISTAQDLLSERKKVTILMWVVSTFILAISVLISIFLSEKMVRPLKDMTIKAIQISEGKDVPHKFEGSNEYWEFYQLSEAFNTMFTHLKEAEERSRYQELLENVDDAVYIMDKHGFIIEANTASYESLGYSREQFLNLRLSKLVPHNDYKTIISLGEEADEISRLKRLTIETVHIGKCGNSIPVEIQSRPIIYMGKRVILNVARNITERIEAEKHKTYLENQLTHAQKMEAMGTMAGCIAHDFNNLLTAIQGNVDLLMMKLEREQFSYTRLKAIDKTIDSATSLTKQLMRFARGEKSESTPLNVNELVEASTDLFIKSRKEIELKLNFENDIWLVSADRGQLEQVIVNLCINSWQAMPSGGELSIRTMNIRLDDTFCGPFKLPGGDYVHISVSDTGVGMAPEIMDKIFDPFFTTKESGKGTGLGLASVYGIIRDHKGMITAESEIGKGTTFNIYLPSVKSPDEI